MEDDVENFYNNLLPQYFLAKENYGVQQESRAAKKPGLQRSDFTIRIVKHGVTLLR